MVVRAVISTVIDKLPYSDHIPSIVTNLLKESETSSLQTLEDDYTTSPTSTLRSLSPKDKIHYKLLTNRINNVSDDDEDLTISCLNYSDTCDSLPYHLKPPPTMNRLKDNESTLVSSGSINSEEAINMSFQMRQYLNEQNKKFDDLINKNLDIFLRQQDKFGEEENGDNNAKSGHNRRMVKNIINSTYNRIWSLLSKRKKEGDGEYDEGVRNESDKEHLVSNEKEMNDEFDDIINNLNNDSGIESFVDSLDHDKKLSLLNSLKKDLGSINGSVITSDEDNSNLAISNNDLLIDKFQIFLIISIKLMFIGAKLFIPLTYFIYLKFINDQLILINKRNMNKLLTFIIKIMDSLEKKLSTNESLKNYQYSLNKVYNEGLGTEQSNHLQLNEKFIEHQNVRDLYEEMTLNAASFFNNNLNNKDNSWKRSILEYLINKYIQLYEKPNYYSNPKYSRYFSSNCHSPDDRSSSNESFKSISSSSPTKNSSESSQDLSVLQVAEQFIDELSS